MVVVVRRTRGWLGSGHGAARNSGAVGEGCQQRGRSLFACVRLKKSEERLAHGLAGWQLFCSLQRGF